VPASFSELALAPRGVRRLLGMAEARGREKGPVL
jgi:hypothetical protein